MKPSPNYDFSISIRHQTCEEEPEVAALYQGIFNVILNHTVNIMFVPDIIIDSQYWPPVLPENVDDISTEIEARLITVGLSRYTVTPNLLLAGKEEVIPQTDSDYCQSGVVFFVTHDEFKIFSKELSILTEEIPSLHSSKKASEIQDLNFIKFILSHIIPSKYFAEQDLQILGREKVYF